MNVGPILICYRDTSFFICSTHEQASQRTISTSDSTQCSQFVQSHVSLCHDTVNMRFVYVFCKGKLEKNILQFTLQNSSVNITCQKLSKAV